MRASSKLQTADRNLPPAPTPRSQKQGYDVSYLLWGNGPDVARRVRSFAAKTS